MRPFADSVLFHIGHSGFPTYHLRASPLQPAASDWEVGELTYSVSSILELPHPPNHNSRLRLPSTSLIFNCQNECHSSSQSNSNHCQAVRRGSRPSSDHPSAK